MDKFKIVLLYFSFGLSFFFARGQQIGNYVNNGSFEECLNCQSYSPLLRAKYWNAIDSTKSCGNLLTSLPPSMNVPTSSYCYQWPHFGNNYFITGLLDIMGSTSLRGYPKNKLKQNLIAGKVYCVGLYYSITNQSTYGVNSFGIYFGGTSLDTIKICNKAITYLTPQIQNPPTNFLTDTLNWVAFTGTFTANGTEKYMVLGNFKSDIATDTVLINPTNLPTIANEILYDDVTCIEFNLAAYAGPDKLIYPGDSVYIGRESDFAIDPGCIWYKLPNMTTALDTISGLWVKPSVTSTYVVRQELDCSSVKWDTVVVTINHNLVGIDNTQSISDNISLFPNPTSGNLSISFSGSVPTDITKYSIIDNLGQVIREEEIDLKKTTFIVSTSDLVNGLYQIHFKTSFGSVTKKFVKLN